MSSAQFPSFRAFAIPTIASLGLGVIPGCGTPSTSTLASSPTPLDGTQSPIEGTGTPTPQGTPTPTPVPGVCVPQNDTMETSSGQSCQSRSQTCCPEEEPGDRSPPIAGHWRLESGGEYYNCGAWNFDEVAARFKATGIEPTNCYASTMGSLRISRQLKGCFDLYSQWASIQYDELVQECASHDLSVDVSPLGEGAYRIRLTSTEESLDLSCQLEGETLDCSESPGQFVFGAAPW